MKGEYRVLTLEWLDKAESDLGYARASFQEFERFYSQMCILCHDSAEKYLKAYLVSQGMRPERTHDLPALLTECVRHAEYKGRLLAMEPHCRILNRYYTPIKYPSHYPEMTREQAKLAIESAEAVRTEILSVIGVDPLQGYGQ